MADPMAFGADGGIYFFVYFPTQLMEWIAITKVVAVKFLLVEHNHNVPVRVWAVVASGSGAIKVEGSSFRECHFAHLPYLIYYFVTSCCHIPHILLQRYKILLNSH